MIFNTVQLSYFDQQSNTGSTIRISPVSNFSTKSCFSKISIAHKIPFTDKLTLLEKFFPAGSFNPGALAISLSNCFCFDVKNSISLATEPCSSRQIFFQQITTSSTLGMVLDSNK